MDGKLWTIPASVSSCPVAHSNPFGVLAATSTTSSSVPESTQSSSISTSRPTSASELVQSKDHVDDFSPDAFSILSPPQRSLGCIAHANDSPSVHLSKVSKAVSLFAPGSPAPLSSESLSSPPSGIAPEVHDDVTLRRASALHRVHDTGDSMRRAFPAAVRVSTLYSHGLLSFALPSIPCADSAVLAY